MDKKVLYVVIAALVIAVGGLSYVLVSDDETADQESPTEQGETEQGEQETAEDFRVYDANDVIRAFEEAGLEASSVEDQEIGGTAAPATEVESKSLTIPSVAPEGGQILIFEDREGLESKKAWFERFPDLTPYVYVKRNAMVQLNSGVPAEEASNYGDALENM